MYIKLALNKWTCFYGFALIVIATQSTLALELPPKTIVMSKTHPSQALLDSGFAPVTAELGESWIQMSSPIPWRAADTVPVAFNNHLYVFGGGTYRQKKGLQTDYGQYDCVWRLEDHQWKQVAGGLPFKNVELAAAHDGKIYVIALDQNSVRSMFASTNGTAWMLFMPPEQIPWNNEIFYDYKAPYGKGSTKVRVIPRQLTSINNALLAISSKIIWRLENNQWQAECADISDFSTPMFGNMLQEYNNSLVAFSRDGVRVLRPETNSWEMLTTEPSWTEVADDLWGDKRFSTSPSFIKVNDRIIGIGGGYGGHIVSYWHSTNLLEWKKVETETPRYPHNDVQLFLNGDNVIFSIGGSYGQAFGGRQFFSDVWRSSDGVDWQLVTMSAPWSLDPWTGGEIPFAFFIQNELVIFKGTPLGEASTEIWMTSPVKINSDGFFYYQKQ